MPKAVVIGSLVSTRSTLVTTPEARPRYSIQGTGCSTPLLPKMEPKWGGGVALIPSVSCLPSVVSTGGPACTEPLLQKNQFTALRPRQSEHHTVSRAECRGPAHIQITEMLFKRTVMCYGDAAIRALGPNSKNLNPLAFIH